MERILVSACLLGVPVRYDGRAKTRDDEILARWRSEGRLLSCCPEVSGGLPVPRPAAEVTSTTAGEPSVPAVTGTTPGGSDAMASDSDRTGGIDRSGGTESTSGTGRTAGTDSTGGAAVLDGIAQVRTVDGVDVTAAFVRGAELALEVAQQYRVRIAVLKEGSPSCGSSRIYDGTFTGRATTGVGVTTALLTRHGIRVFSEDQLSAAAAYLAELESAGQSNE